LISPKNNNNFNPPPPSQIKLEGGEIIYMSNQDSYIPIFDMKLSIVAKPPAPDKKDIERLSQKITMVLV